MEFNQEITVAAPREKVWDFIWQVEEFAACVPGVTDVQKIDESTYGVRVEQKVSFLKASFQLQINIEEVRAPEYIRTVGEGKDSKTRGEPQAEKRGDARGRLRERDHGAHPFQCRRVRETRLARLQRHQEPGEQDFRRIREERESEGGIGAKFSRRAAHHPQYRLAAPPPIPVCRTRHSGVSPD